MIWIDYAILGVITLSALVGFFRGFVREAIGLATWVLAFFIAYKLAEPMAGLLENWISVRSVRLAAAFGGLFIITLVIGAIVNYSIAKLVTGTGFAGTDRALGGVFGVLRGAAILVLLVLFAGLTAVPRDDWWQQSIFIAHLQEGALSVRAWLPSGLAEEINFDQQLDLAPQTPPATQPAQTVN